MTPILILSVLTVLVLLNIWSLWELRRQGRVIQTLDARVQELSAVSEHHENNLTAVHCLIDETNHRLQAQQSITEELVSAQHEAWDDLTLASAGD